MRFNKGLFRLPILFAATLFVLGLGACSSDDSASPPADTFSLSLDGAATVTATDGTGTSCVFAAYSTANDATVVVAVLNIDQAAGTFDFVFLGAPGQAAGTFTEAEGANVLAAVGGVGFFSLFGTGTVTWTTFGAVGELITGEFDFTDSGGTSTFTGDFSVTREADDFDTTTAVC